MNRLSLAISLCCLASLHTISAAAATVPIPTDTVADRVRPELQPLGLHVGTFTLLPELGVDMMRVDNIYSQAEDQIDDTVRIFRPSIDLRSNWSRHALNVTAFVESGRYVNNPTENYDDTRIVASGKIDVTRRSGFRISARLDSLHEDRFSPDNRQGATPTLFDRSTFSVGYEHARGQLSLQFDVVLASTDFDDVSGVQGIIENDDRDRDRMEVVVQTSYEVTPDVEVSARARVLSFDYATPIDEMTLNRSSSGYELAVGAKFEPTPLTTLDAYVGYGVRDYDDTQLQDINSTIFGANFTWRVSGLTTVSATALRSIEETALAGAGGIISTRVGLGVDHELLRNLLLHASVYRRETDFTSIDRKNDDRGTRLAATYLMNRRFTIELEYDSRERNFLVIDRPQADFNTGIVSLSLKGAR